MTTTVTLENEAARALERLRQQAVARGIPLEQYLKALADHREGGAAQHSPHDLTPTEFRQWLRDVSSGMPSLPPIPADFSRADVYDDHD